MNKPRLQQALIDLAVAVLAAYIVLLAPLPGQPSSSPPLPGHTLLVQLEGAVGPAAMVADNLWQNAGCPQGTCHVYG